MKIDDYSRFEPGKSVEWFQTADGDEFYACNFESLTLAIVSLGEADVPFILGVRPFDRARWWPLSAVKCAEWAQ